MQYGADDAYAEADINAYLGNTLQKRPYINGAKNAPASAPHE